MDWIPPEILQLIESLGAPAVMALIIVWTFSRRETANVKQDDTITNFSVEFNAERRQLQESNNRLQAELMDVRLVQATEAGRREQLEKAIERERNEWKTERNEFNEKFRKMEARILELETHREASKERIRELEIQVAALEKAIAEKDAEIRLLQGQKRELESLLEKETNRAETLSGLVTKLQTPTPSTTQPIPEMDVDDTHHPHPDTENDEAA